MDNRKYCGGNDTATYVVLQENKNDYNEEDKMEQYLNEPHVIYIVICVSLHFACTHNSCILYLF